MNIRRCDHQTLIPDKTDDMGLWTMMKQNKIFWLLPITIGVLLVGGLVVWEQLSLAPSMVLEEDHMVLY